MSKKRTWLAGTADNNSTLWVQLDQFDTVVNSGLKKIMPGPYRWHGPSKRWIFPLNWDACTNLRKVADRHGATIRISNELHDWATRERAHQESIPDVGAVELVDLLPVREQAPGIWRALSSRPFQSVGVAFAARNRACLIADQPGLGKTLQAIGAIVEAGTTGPILIVAPKQAAKLTWPKEIRRWLGNDESIVQIGAHMPASERAKVMQFIVDNQENVAKRLWVVTSPNYVRIKAELDDYGNYVKDHSGKKIIKPVGESLLEFQNVLWSAIIVDESHQILPVPSGNKKKQSAQRLGIGALEVRTNGLRMALSGTPFRGKEVYLWGTLNWLRPDLYRAYWKWVEQHFWVTNNGFGMQIGGMKSAENLYAEAKNVMIRRTKAEVAQDLPPKFYAGEPLDPSVPGSPVAVWLDMLPQQKQAYDDMVKSATAEIEGGLLMANGLLAEMTRLKQFAGSCGIMDEGTGNFKAKLPSNKFDWIVEWLEERGIEKGMKIDQDTPKVVIASQFAGLINAIASGLTALGIRAHVFTGATTDKMREQIKDDWQDNPASEFRILLLSTKAGGVSLTLDAADDLIICDETYDPSDQEQLEDRLHRISRDHQVTIWNLRSRGTIEENIAKSNMQAEFNIKNIIDGSRGANFAKELLGV